MIGKRSPLKINRTWTVVFIHEPLISLSKFDDRDSFSWCSMRGINGQGECSPERHVLRQSNILFTFSINYSRRRNDNRRNDVPNRSKQTQQIQRFPHSRTADDDCCLVGGKIVYLPWTNLSNNEPKLSSSVSVVVVVAAAAVAVVMSSAIAGNAKHPRPGSIDFTKAICCGASRPLK